MSFNFAHLRGGGFQSPPIVQIKGSPMFDVTYGRSMGVDNRPAGMIRNGMAIVSIDTLKRGG